MHPRVDQRGPWPLPRLVHVVDGGELTGHTHVAFVPVHGLLHRLVVHVLLVLVDLFAAHVAGFQQATHRQAQRALSAATALRQQACRPIRVLHLAFVLPLERQRAQGDDGHGIGIRVVVTPCAAVAAQVEEAGGTAA